MRHTSLLKSYLLIKKIVSAKIRCNITGSKNTNTDTNTWNVYRMFVLIYIEYRNPETRKTRNWFRYETFYYLWVKGYSTWGERDTIFLCWLLLHRQLPTQPTRGARSSQICLASPISESRLSRSEAGTQIPPFLKSPNPQPTLPGMTSPTSPGPNFYLGFLFWHLWMTHPLRARVNTCAHVCT